MLLSGLKVVQFQGLAPSMFAGMFFVNHGASVLLVARPPPDQSMGLKKTSLNQGKQVKEFNLKNAEHLLQIKQILKQADLVIDPYRPGVLEKAGLGPVQISKINHKICFMRISGYGANSQQVGHDINYIAQAGALAKMGNNFPGNLLADFAGVLVGISYTLVALVKARSEDRGFQIDCSLTDGAAFLLNKSLDQKGQLKLYDQKSLQKIKQKYGEKLLTPLQVPSELLISRGLGRIVDGKLRWLSPWQGNL